MRKVAFESRLKINNIQKVAIEKYDDQESKALINELLSTEKNIDVVDLDRLISLIGNNEEYKKYIDIAKIHYQDYDLPMKGCKFDDIPISKKCLIN